VRKNDYFLTINMEPESIQFSTFQRKLINFQFYHQYFEGLKEKKSLVTHSLNRLHIYELAVIDFTKKLHCQKCIQNFLGKC
jgi:hypothetical protein